MAANADSIKYCLQTQAKRRAPLEGSRASSKRRTPLQRGAGQRDVRLFALAYYILGPDGPERALSLFWGVLGLILGLEHGPRVSGLHG